MPQIREYRSQTSGPGVVKQSLISGEDVSGGLGKAVQSLSSGVMDVVDVVAKQKKQQQDFEVEKMSFQEQLDLNDYMQDLKMKAPAGADGFTDQARTELERRREDILNKASSDYMREQLDMKLRRIHMGTMQDSIQFEAESKAKKDRLDVEAIGNRTRNAVRMNPATSPKAIESMNALIDATSLPSDVKMQWKAKELQDIRQNEIRGWIDINPVRAKEMIQTGTWSDDLSDDLRNTLENEADQGIRALEIEKNRTKKLNDDASEAKREAIKDDFIKKAIGGNLSANEIVQNTDLKAAEKEHFLRQLKNNSFNMQARSNPALFNSMVEQISEGKIISDKQILEKLGQGLTWSDVQHLRRELRSDDNSTVKQDKVFKKGLDDIAKGMLTKSNAMGLRDPEGDVQLQKWRIFAAEQFQDGLARGLTTKQMTDPDSPDYIGKHLNKFTKTPEQIMKSVYNKYSNPANQLKEDQVTKIEAAPRQPGESAADYLKRTKNQ